MIEKINKDQDVDFKVSEKSVAVAAKSMNPFWYKVGLSILAMLVIIFIAIILFQVRQINGLTVEIETLKAALDAAKAK